MAKTDFTQLVVRVVLICALFFPFSGSTQVEANRELTVGMGVWGIVRYTRWPYPLQSLDFCFTGETSLRHAIVETSYTAAPEYNTVFKDLSFGEDPSACEVIYAGRLSPEQATSLIKKLADKPILLVGEGRDFCTTGGMFCIEEEYRFAANLDAISRSSLRVNPQVLRLFIRLREME